MFICKAYLLTNSGTSTNQIVTNYSPETRPPYVHNYRTTEPRCRVQRTTIHKAEPLTHIPSTYSYYLCHGSQAAIPSESNESPFDPGIHININYVSSCRKFRKPCSMKFLLRDASHSSTLSCRRNRLHSDLFVNKVTFRASYFHWRIDVSDS